MAEHPPGGTAQRHDPVAGRRRLRRPLRGPGRVLVVAGLLAGAGALQAGAAQAGPVPAPAIEVSYTTVGLLAAPGGDVGAQLAVRNTGQSPVTVTDLLSDRAGDLAGKGDCAVGAVLAPGEGYTCSWPTHFTGPDGATRVDTVTAMATDSSTASAQDSSSSITTIGTAQGSGLIALCVRADDRAGTVSGTYDLDLLGHTVPVPVGSCTTPFAVASGDVTVLQEALPGQRLSACASSPVVRLRRCDPAGSRAVVHVATTSGGSAGAVPAVRTVPIGSSVAGSPLPTISQLTLVVQAKRVRTTGSLTICSVSDGSVPTGTPVAFTVGGRPLSVPVGPAYFAGYCRTMGGFALGAPVTVTQTQVDGVYGIPLAVAPSDREVSSDGPSQTIVATAGLDRTYVLFGSTTDPCPTARMRVAVPAC